MKENQTTVIFEINFKVFVENVTKAEGTFPNESIYEKKKQEMKEASVQYSFA